MIPLRILAESPSENQDQDRFLVDTILTVAVKINLQTLHKSQTLIAETHRFQYTTHAQHSLHVELTSIQDFSLEIYYEVSHLNRSTCLILMKTALDQQTL